MLSHEIRVAGPFHFIDVVMSHGWFYLPPFHWDAETGTLSRVELLSSGDLAVVALRATPDGVRLTAEAPAEAANELIRNARWMLALDEDFTGFHRLCAGHRGLERAALRGQGRILRGPTVWEDVVKTLFSVNTTWRQTVAMTENLVALCGEAGPGGRRAFPTPAAVAAVEPAELQQRCRVGYRAAPLHALAAALAEGSLDLETLKAPSLPDAEVEGRLRALRGIGPYAAANVMMLLGRYDHLPVDSWLRQTARDGWFGGAKVSDREIEARFEPFRPYRTLVYRFYDWKSEVGEPVSR